MKTKLRTTLLFFILTSAFLFLFSGYCMGQEAEPADRELSPSEIVEEKEKEALELRRVQSLNKIIQSIEQAERDLAESQRILNSKQGSGREKELQLEIQQRSANLESLRKSFEEIASGVDVSAFYPKKEEPSEISFTTELKDLLSPLINELKRATSRPREIDRLRTELTESTEMLSVANQAKKNIELLSEEVEPKSELAIELANTAEKWVETKNKLQARASIAEQKLQQRLGEKKTFAESAKEVFQLFFKSRGRNLFLALFLAIFFSFVVQKLQARLQKTRLAKREEKTLNIRLFNLTFFLLSGVGSLLVFMVVLFIFGDWVLLILAFMVVLGIAWTSKEALPRFWGQAALLLNMGPVREGERVVFNGVPFRVKTLNYYSILENPLLDGSPVRLPLKDLSDLRSRESRATEPWFPTERGDWILTEDSKVGQVELQTAQFVRVALLGGARRNYFSEEFIAKNFTVISKGYRIKTIFGVDYQHQADATESIPNKLREYVVNGLNERGYEQDKFECVVEFNEAGASSLDIAIVCRFPGEWAKDYETLERLVAKLAVDACNTEGWVIPFTQITMHMANQS